MGDPGLGDFAPGIYDSGFVPTYSLSRGVLICVFVSFFLTRGKSRGVPSAAARGSRKKCGPGLTARGGGIQRGRVSKLGDQGDVPPTGGFRNHWL